MVAEWVGRCRREGNDRAAASARRKSPRARSRRVVARDLARGPRRAPAPLAEHGVAEGDRGSIGGELSSATKVVGSRGKSARNEFAARPWQERGKPTRSTSRPHHPRSRAGASPARR